MIIVKKLLHYFPKTISSGNPFEADPGAQNAPKVDFNNSPATSTDTTKTR